MLILKDVDAAWIAGIFEGEGSLFLVKQIRKERNNEHYEYIRMTVTSTDLDVLEKIKKIIGSGTIVKQTDKAFEKFKEKNWKRKYYWQLSNREEISWVVWNMWNHLCSRRRAKILELDLLEKMF